MQSLAYLKLKRNERLLEAKNAYTEELEGEIATLSKLANGEMATLTDGSNTQLKKEFEEREIEFKNQIEKLNDKIEYIENDRKLITDRYNTATKELNKVKEELKMSGGIREEVYNKVLSDKEQLFNTCMQMETDIAKHISTINNLKIETEEKGKEIKRLQDECSSKDAEINNLSSDCEAKDNEIAGYIKQLEDYDMSREESTSQDSEKIRSLEEELQKEKERNFATIQDYESQLKTLNNKIRELEESEGRRKSGRRGGIFGGGSL